MCVQENPGYKELCFKKIVKSEMKLNAEHLFELVTLEINVI